MWDSRTGQELPGEAAPETVRQKEPRPDGQYTARVSGNTVELVFISSEKMAADELAYRMRCTEPKVGQYVASYTAALTAKDAFAATFYTLTVVVSPFTVMT